MRSRSLFALCLLLQAGPALADLRIVARESANGRTTGTVTHWIGDSKRAKVNGDLTIVTRLDLGKVYVVDRGAKTYQARDVVIGPMLPVSAVKTDETAIVGKWLCRKYRVEGRAAHQMQIDLWVTKDIELDADAFSRQMAVFGQEAGAEWLQAYLQIDGFPVVQEIVAEQGEVRQSRRSEVVSVDVAAPPNDTYLPPRGFKKQK